jgi:hypothetical protein
MKHEYKHSPKYDIENGVDETLKIYTFAVTQYKLYNSGKKIVIQETLARNMTEAKEQIAFRNRGNYSNDLNIIYREF